MRETVKSLAAKVEALEKRLEALERPRRKLGFEYEGSVGGDYVPQHEQLDTGDRKR